jgi:hypothetical protein
MNRLSLRQKLWMPLILSWLGLLTLTVWHAYQTRDLQLSERHRDLGDIVEMSYSIAAGLDKLAQSDKMSADAAKQEAIARIGDLRYDGGGYVTIVGADSVMVMHPISPKLNGKDMSDWKDAKGNALYKAIAAADGSPEGGGFLENAGKAMADIVTAVKRVTTIVEDIATASNQQSVGIEEVNRAIAQMDGTTQQNAALVEQAAAAASSMNDQALRLGEAMQSFRLTPA